MSVLTKLFKKPSVERSVEKTLEKVKVPSYLEVKIERIASPLPENIEIIDRYQAGYNRMASVTIYRDMNTDVYVYHMEEPPISPTVENLYRLVKERFQSMEMELPERITEREVVYERYIQEALKELGYEDAYTKYPELRYYLIRDLAGWRIIDVPMRDVRVEEIDYSNPNGTLSVVVKHDKVQSTWVDTNVVLSEEELAKLIEFIAFKTGKQISVAQPLLEARTPEGYRVAANLKEVGMSSAFTIRKFPENPLSLTVLIKNKTMSPLLAAYLWTLVENMRFILVVGGMATGKTTVLQAITSVIPRDRKVVCVAPGTMVVTNKPTVIDALFDGAPIVNGNIESVEKPVKILAYRDGRVFWTVSEKVHRIHIPRDIKLRRMVTEFGAEVTVTPNTLIPVLTPEGIKYKRASDVKPGDLIPQLAFYEPLSLEVKDKYTLEDLPVAPIDHVLAVAEELLRRHDTGKELVVEATAEEVKMLAVALLRLGVVASVDLERGMLRVSGCEYKRLRDVVKQKRVARDREYIWVRVKSVEDIEHGGVVYDLTPRDARYFFAGNGGFIVVEDTIEDTPELRLDHPRWQALYTRRSVYGTEQDVTLFDLARYSLRTRGQYIIIGEVRDREIQTLVQMAASVSRDTPVLVRVNGEVKPAKIEDIVDKIYEEAGNPPDWTRVAPKQKIEVLTLTSDGRVDFKPVKWVLRHYHSGKLYRIWYSDKDNATVGGHVDITGNHSIFVKMGDRVIAVRGDEVKPGDKLIIMRGWLDREPREAVVYKVEQIEYDGYVYDFSVPDTEAFFGGTIPVLLHNSGHGSLCLAPGELVRVRINGKIEEVPIGILVEKVLAGEVKDVEVLSIDLTSRRTEWKRVKRVYKVSTKEWITIHTSSGVAVKATPDHRFPLASGRIVRADELKPSDTLLVYVDGNVTTEKIVSIEREMLGGSEWSYDIEVEDNHTFLVNGRVFTMNCTFHAEDPETLFLRMTSPPLSVQPSFLLTIAAVVLQQRVWSRKHRKFVRRTGKVWEIIGIKPTVREGEIPVLYKEVFAWDPAEDYHYPDNEEDLVRESKQLQVIARSTYGEDEWYNRIVWELSEKRRFLEQLVEEGVFDFKEVTERIYRKSLELRQKG